MASAGVAPSGYKTSSSTSMGVEKLPDQMNELKIRDEKVLMLSFILFFFGRGITGICSVVCD
jgi:kinase